MVFFIKSGRGERIRTFDTLVPNQVLYQTELRPETTPSITCFLFIASAICKKYLVSSMRFVLQYFWNERIYQIFGRNAVAGAGWCTGA